MKKSKKKFLPQDKDTTSSDVAISKNNFEIKGRIWIEGKHGTFLGYGRVVLLERIKEYSSLSKAAKSMEMSYKHAWDLMQSINSQSSEPLVTTVTGGKGGGGAQLTAKGEKAIEEYYRLYERFKEFLENETKNLDF